MRERGRTESAGVSVVFSGYTPTHKIKHIINYITGDKDNGSLKNDIFKEQKSELLYTIP